MMYVTSKPQEVEFCQEITGTSREDNISALSDDLLVHILSFLPTKAVVATMFLSKRWRSIWSMVPRLEYRERKYITCGEESVWWFLDNSMQHHKAPILESLSIELGERCPSDADVNKWIGNAIKRSVCMLDLILEWSSEPIGLPTSLYTCETLVELSLKGKLLLDLPPSVCLASLKKLVLKHVLYKDEVSLVRLLSGCPVLEELTVYRLLNDNMTYIIVEVPSLKSFHYDHSRRKPYDGADVGDLSGSLVIDCPALTDLYISGFKGNSCSSKNMPWLDRVLVLHWYPDERFLESISSTKELAVEMSHAMVNCCKAAYFSRLRLLAIWPMDSYWMQPLMLLVTNSPTLKELRVHGVPIPLRQNIPWNQPNSVPTCLSSNLELLQWDSFGGTMEENKFAAYILGNSKCLKKATFYLPRWNDLEKIEKMREELYSMNRASTTIDLIVKIQLRQNNLFSFHHRSIW